MPNPLLAALAAGFQQYGNQKLAANQAEQQRIQDAETKRLAEEAARRKAIFEASLKAPEIKSYEDTENGRTVKRTLMQRIDPETGSWNSEQIGMAAQERKAPTTRNIIQGDQTTTQQFDPETGEWIELGSGPRFAPKSAGGGQGESATISFEEYNAMSPETQARYDRYKGRALPTDSEAKDRKWVTSQTNSTLRIFDRKDPYEKKKDLLSYGIDPNDPKARDKYKDMIRDDLLTDAGMSLFDGRVNSGASTNAKKPGESMGKPGSSKDNPAPAESFKTKPPAGTWVKLPDGQVIKIT